MPSRPLPPHWPQSLEEAKALQNELREGIRLSDMCRSIRTIAAADVAYSKEGDWAWAGALLFAYPDLEPTGERYVRFGAAFPYVPGFLFLREWQGLLEVLSLSPKEPDLILFDGQGIAHPRSLGLASHLGVLLQKPSIGCAKGRLAGEFEEWALGKERGSWVPLMYEGREVGAAVRTRTGVKPLFVSPGHLISLERSIEVVLQCCGRFRLPEPLRQAHLRVERRKRGEER